MRESPNVRRSFDGASLIGQIGSIQFTILAARPVALRQGVFDDAGNRQQAIWGLYTTIPFTVAPSGTGLDLYYLGFGNTHARYVAFSGNEVRHSIGARLFGAASGWDWDWEAIGQFGSVSHRSVGAWSVATNTGYGFKTARWSPHIEVKANIASGSGNPNGRTVGTFNPLFPKLAYFNEASLFAPSNFYDLNPEISVTPMPGVTVSVGWDFLWRAEKRDAIYLMPFTPMAGTAGRGGAEIGNQVALDVAWQVDRHLQFSGSYVHFNAGKAIRAAGGHDIDFGLLQAAYRF